MNLKKNFNKVILGNKNFESESAYFGFVGKYLNLNPNIRFNSDP